MFVARTPLLVIPLALTGGPHGASGLAAPRSSAASTSAARQSDVYSWLDDLGTEGPFRVGNGPVRMAGLQTDRFMVRSVGHAVADFSGLNNRKVESMVADDVNVDSSVATGEPKKKRPILRHGFKKPVDTEGLTDSDGMDTRSMNVVIAPRAKLAFCYFPKVACAEMNLLFNNLNGIRIPQNRSIFHLSSPAALGVNWKDVTHENGWKFAFFVRDPLERYLSAFGSKCLFSEKKGKVEDNGKFCSGTFVDHPVGLEDMVSAFEDHVQHAFETYYSPKHGLVIGNAHFKRQHQLLERCGLDRFRPGTADFVGDMSGDMHSQVLSMLELADVPNATAVVDKYFPAAGHSGHMSATHGNKELFYENKAIADLVKRMYRDDYKLLKDVQRTNSND